MKHGLRTPKYHSVLPRWIFIAPIVTVNLLPRYPMHMMRRLMDALEERPIDWEDSVLMVDGVTN